MPADGFEAADVWKAQGRGFQMAVAQHEGQIIHFTGQVAWDANENIIGKGNVAEQTRQCFRNIERLLHVGGGELSDIVSITTYFTDRAQLPVIQQVRSEFLPPDTAPVSTSVMVAGLGHPDFLVELTPIAVIPNARYKASQRSRSKP